MKKRAITVAVVGAVAVAVAVRPGQRVEFGFQASRPGGNTATPTNFSYVGS